MNCYATLDQIKARLDETATDHDALLVDILEEASRHVEAVAGRVFWTTTAARYFDGPAVDAAPVLLDDLLSVSEVAADAVGDGAEWTVWAATDYQLYPWNRLPKWQILTAPEGDYSFPAVRRGLRITGVWGFGDGRRAAPWDALAVTLTLSTAAATSGTASAAGVIEAGQTLLVGTEQVFCSAASGTTVTVVRGVNGTTAAAHSAAAVSVAAYPVAVRKLALVSAVEIYNQRRLWGFAAERVGEWSYTADQADAAARRDRRLLGNLVRLVL